MRIVARNTLVAFWDRHPDARKAARWADPQAVLADFSKEKALDGERVRFEVGGGDYRLIVAFDFARQAAFIKFVGTHADYDRVDALTVSLF